MKANPGGNLEPAAILGREAEIEEIWHLLKGRSVVFTAERRIGKTCLIRKMLANPREGWVSLMAFVESKRHPIEVIQALYDEAESSGLRSRRKIVFRRIRSALRAIDGTGIGEWRLHLIKSDWKQLLNSLFEDLAEVEERVLVVLDEFPHLVANMAADDPGMAMEFLDLMREIRQRLEPEGGIRFILAGSIGLHLVIQHLKDEHGYGGNPTNDMAVHPLAGMSAADTALMCRRYLDEEGIQRDQPADFDRRMLEATDGLPLYIQYVCQIFQSSGKRSVTPGDIDTVLQEMLDRPEVEWFEDTAKRLKTHYGRLGLDTLAFNVLAILCREDRPVPESDIRDYVLSQMVIEDEQSVLFGLELLTKDHYIVRESLDEGRHYRFRYELMRRWWHRNKGAA